MKSVYEKISELHTLVGNSIGDGIKSDIGNLAAGKRFRKNMNKVIKIANEAKKLVIVKRKENQ